MTVENTTLNLLPCPFCGGDAKMHGLSFLGVAKYQVICDECGARSEPEAFINAAESVWNRRTK